VSYLPQGADLLRYILIYHNLGVCHTYLKEWYQAADLLRYILIYHNLGVCHTYLREWDQAADLLRYQQKILSY
jgi:hypothetical protein